MLILVGIAKRGEFEARTEYKGLSTEILVERNKGPTSIVVVGCKTKALRKQPGVPSTKGAGKSEKDQWI
jgi:hypothetical protein